MTAADLRLERYDVLPSTNDLAKSRAALGEPAGLVLVADRQTAGRGRMTRSFYSPPGCGLYLSILLRPDLAAADALLLTTATAVVVAEAIEAVTGIETGIKWVNDLYLDGRKVCGILAESGLRPDGRLAWTVIGIGLNVRAPVDGYPDDLRDIATALLPHDAPDLRPALTDAILARLIPAVEALPDRSHLAAYRARSILLGRTVTLSTTGQTVLVRDIDGQGGLVVEDAVGHRFTVTHGDCSVRV